jgi:uncharacterized protein (TIGR02300 family)
MATKQARGTKRTCQSNECGARFYDLNRSPISCPICGSIYELASSPLALSAASEEKSSRRGRKSDYTEKAPVEATGDSEADEALVELEDAEEGAAAGEEDETFLEEEEEEGGDVSNIIGGPVAEGDEER